MMKRLGLVVASLAAVAVIFAGASTFACGDECKSKNTAKTASVSTKGCCPGSSNAAMAGDKAHCGTAGVQTADMKASGNGCGSKNAVMAGDRCSTKGATAGNGCSSKASMAGNGCSSKASMAGGKMCGTKTAGSGSTCGTKASMATKSGCGTKSEASKAGYAANVYIVKDGQKYAVAQGKTFEVTDATPYYDMGTARYYFADKESMSACAEKMSLMAAEIDREAVSLATAEANVEVDSYGKKYGMCPVTHDKFVVTADSPAKVMDGQKYYVCSEKCAHDLLQPALHTDSHSSN